jgi:hypothetical protein
VSSRRSGVFTYRFAPPRGGATSPETGSFETDVNYATGQGTVRFRPNPAAAICPRAVVDCEAHCGLPCAVRGGTRLLDN